MGPQRGRVRLARTGVFALVCLALAGAAHVAAGGALPPLGVLLIAALPVWFGGWLLTSRRLGVPALTGALGAAQVGLHAFFHATAAHASAAQASAVAPHITATAAEHAAHLGHGDPSGAAGFAGLTQAAPGLATHGGTLDLLTAGLSPVMLLAHLAATLASALVLAYGEDVLWRVLRRFVAVPAIGGRPPVVGPLHPTPPCPAAPPRARVLLTTIPRRGPPVASAR